MRRGTLLAASFVTLAGLAAAQQFNQPGASMVFNGFNGPPWPIAQNLPRGLTATVALAGSPSSVFIVGGAAGVAPAGLPYAGGLVDLDLASLAIVFNGLQNAVYSIGPAGTFVATFLVAGNTPLGLQRAFQMIVADPLVATGVSLSAATLLTVVPGLTVLPLTMSDNSTSYVDLTPYGFGLQFYGQSYTGVWVNSNGTLSFGAGSVDQVAQTSSFLIDMPRIAGFWTDLDPGIGGTITFTIDQTTPIAFVKCDFTNVAEFLIGTPHTFSMQVFAPPVGDVILTQGLFNIQSLISTVVGISPGQNQSAHPERDLSSLNVLPGAVGTALENFHELFPTPPTQHTFDLAGKTISFYASNLGMPNASYTCFTYP